MPCLLHRAYPKGTIPAAGTAPSEGHCVNNKHGAEGAVRIPDGPEGGPRRYTLGVVCLAGGSMLADLSDG